MLHSLPPSPFCSLSSVLVVFWPTILGVVLIFPYFFCRVFRSLACVGHSFFVSCLFILLAVAIWFRWMAIFRVESDLYIHPSIGKMYALSTTTTTTTITIFSPCRFIQASIFCWLESICIHYVIMNVSLYISSDVWNVIFGLAFFFSPFLCPFKYTAV